MGTRCEMKNLNSVKFMTIAISQLERIVPVLCIINSNFTVHEIRRQVSILEKGGSVPQETRGFDEEKAETYTLRSKEDAPDYRYMPDPNLPPLLLNGVGTLFYIMALTHTFVRITFLA